MRKLIWYDFALFACKFCAEFGIDLQELYAKNYCEGGQLNCNQWQTSWMNVQERASGIISENWAGDEPSPFKQVAASALAIVEFAPIPEFIEFELVEAKLSKQALALRSTSRTLAASVAYAFGKAFLEGATIGRNEQERKINNPLNPTDHFKADFLIALALTSDAQLPFGKVPEPLRRVSESFNFVTLVFESLAYAAEN